MKGAERLALVSFAVAAGLSTVSARPTQAPTFRATTEVVLVDVLVTRGNVPVENLRAEDFDVRDAGVRQKVERVLTSTMPVDLLIAMDVSASLAGAPLEHLKSAARAAIGALQPSDRALLLTFSDDVRAVAGWTTDRHQALEAVDLLRAEGWTSVVDAAFTALTLPETPGHRPLLLLVTDGRDNASWLSPVAALKAAEQSRMTVYGVSARPAGQTTAAPASLRERLLSDPAAFRAMFLPVIVHDTGGELLFASGSDLSATLVEVLNRFRRRYILSYTPAGVARGGWHPIEVRVRGAGLSVRARRGYTR